MRDFQVKYDGSKLFKILFEEMISLSLKSNKIPYDILRYIAELLTRYNLKTNFNCDLDIFEIMKDLA